MEEKKEMDVPQELSPEEIELGVLELLNFFSPGLMRPWDYTLLGIHRYNFNAGDWETPLREGMLRGDPLAARYMAVIACLRGEWRRTEAYLRYARRLSRGLSAVCKTALPIRGEDSRKE